MGTRINYEIVGDTGASPGAILYSNSHHETERPDEIFRAHVDKCGGQYSRLVRELLAMKYATECRGHKAGENMFSIDLEPFDRELVIRVTFSGEAIRIEEFSVSRG